MVVRVYREKTMRKRACRQEGHQWFCIARVADGKDGRRYWASIDVAVWDRFKDKERRCKRCGKFEGTLSL